MNPTTLIVLLAAAALHAGWNLLVKQAGEKHVFTWWALLAGWRWLNEPLGRQRLAGAALICAGILLIAFAG